jgi:hypothetical protein
MALTSDISLISMWNIAQDNYNANPTFENLKVKTDIENQLLALTKNNPSEQIGTQRDYFYLYATKKLIVYLTWYYAYQSC